MISAPDDYGMNEQQTLAFRFDEPAPPNFDIFWKIWREAVADMPLRINGDVNTDVSEITFESARNVMIVGRLSRPSGVIRGAVVTTHGYDVDSHFSESEEPWHRLGLATLRLRVRGYPPSTIDMPDLRGQWILHNIGDPNTWILNGAVADVIQAVRIVREVFAPDVSVALHGESFGGGLAVLAAAQLEHLGAPADRLILGLPTFGAWRWRIGRYCNGAGGQVNMFVDVMRGDDQARLIESLSLFDAVHHARDIMCPALCKLACLDDVVPAPTAAATFHALQSPAKRAIVTMYGHYDGGIADLRRHVLFERHHPSFADPELPPEEAVRELNLSGPGPATESPKLL